jgi:RNA polymerase sigma factor for flagellar operon FliA
MSPREALCRRDELVRHHLPLVHQIARRLRRRLGPWLDLEDLEAHGRVGLLEAAARYRRASGGFQGFATPRIRGAMLDALRANGPFSRRQVQAHRETGSPPVRHVPSEGLAADALAIDELVAQVQVRVRVRRALAMLSGLELAFIHALYYEGKFLAEVGRDLGVSRSWACRLHARAVRRLRDVLDPGLA